MPATPAARRLRYGDVAVVVAVVVGSVVVVVVAVLVVVVAVVVPVAAAVVVARVVAAAVVVDAGVVPAAAGVVEVELVGVVDVDLVVCWVDVVGVEVGVVDGVVVVPVGAGFATCPLARSALSTCVWTVCTCAAIAAAEASAPSELMASSPRSAVWICPTRAGVGCALSVTTIWSAIAVVRHAGQFAFRAPAMLIGAIVLL
jgi:hypothetical protein